MDCSTAESQSGEAQQLKKAAVIASACRALGRSAPPSLVMSEAPNGPCIGMRCASGIRSTGKSVCAWSWR